MNDEYDIAGMPPGQRISESRIASPAEPGTSTTNDSTTHLLALRLRYSATFHWANAMSMLKIYGLVATTLAVRYTQNMAFCGTSVW